MLDRAIDDYSGEEILDAVESIYRDSITGNAVIFGLAVEFVNIHNGDALNAAGRVLPGMERPVRLGGIGTPLVREFAAAEFGARMQMGTFAAKHYLADALDTCHRLPRMWERIKACEVKVAWARHVAQATRHLSEEAAREVDAAVALYADGRKPWTQFQELVEAAIIAADAELAEAREAEAAQRQFARASRASQHGVKGFYLRSTIGAIARFDATVAYLANALKELGDEDSEDFRRVKACAIMANPMHAVELLVAFANHRAQNPADDTDADRDTDPDTGEDTLDAQIDSDADTDADIDADAETAAVEKWDPPGEVTPLIKPRPFRPSDAPLTASDLGHYRFDWAALLPPVTLYVHLSQDTIDRDEGGVARWEGEGPISAQYVRDHLSARHKFIIKPVIDLANQAPVDAYEIPDRHREAVHLRTPADIFVFSTSTSRDVDIDHNEAHVPLDKGGPPGQSSMENYGPMGRFHHRIKTHSSWEVRQPFPGIWVWRDPHDHFYLVDHTGTRKITRPGKTDRALGRHKAHRQLKAQVWEGTDILEYEPIHAA